MVDQQGSVEEDIQKVAVVDLLVDIRRVDRCTEVDHQDIGSADTEEELLPFPVLID